MGFDDEDHSGSSLWSAGQTFFLLGSILTMFHGLSYLIAGPRFLGYKDISLSPSVLPSSTIKARHMIFANYRAFPNFVSESFYNDKVQEEAEGWGRKSSGLEICCL